MNDMTVGNPTKLVIKFIIPLLIGNIVQQLYAMVDAIIVGQFVGVDALAGVGSTGAINFFIIGFALGLTGGFAVPIAQNFGANDYEAMRNYVAMSIFLTVVGGLILTILSVLGLPLLLKALQTPPEIFDYAYDYMVFVLYGMVASMMYNLVASILRGLGDSKTPLYFLVVASLLNIGLDLLFIINLEMGVIGAGLATTISQGAAAILCMIYIFKKFDILRLTSDNFKIRKKYIRRLLFIGIPMAFQYTIIATGSMIVQGAVNSLGTVYIASITICSKIEQIFFQPYVTLGIAGTTFAAQNLGAKKIDRISEGMKKMTTIGVVMCIVFAVLINVFAEPACNLFLSEGENNDLVIVYAKEFILWQSIFFIPLMALILYRSALQGMGDIKTATAMGITELFGRSFVILAFTGSIGFIAVCVATPAAWTSACLLAVYAYFKRIKWLKRTVEQDVEII
ncbi:MAG: MATE family efflux transporter [Bacillota bacterium]